MKTKKTFEIDTKLFNDFLQFCDLNQLKNPDDEFIKMFITGFNIAKYGVTPFKVKNTKDNFRIKNDLPQKNVESLLENESEKQVTETPSETEKKSTKKVKIIKK